jgi:hypothetical protein
MASSTSSGTSRSEFESAVSEGVEVTLVEVDPDDAITGCEVLDLMERGPKLEHPRRRVEVGPMRLAIPTAEPPMVAARATASMRRK